MTQHDQPDVDPVTFEVVWHQLLDITEEMGIKYMRTSGSPVLVGAYDAATAITLPSGELVAMGPYITTQAHVMRLLVESTTRLRGDSPGIHEDDMWIMNDPYLGATHQPDVATLAPVHHQGELRAWVGSSGHWLDIGGSEPGGFNMNARSVFDEGLRMPPLRIMRGGELQDDIVDLIMTNVREPLVELDMRGQVVSNHTGRSRLRQLYDKYGVELVTSVMRRGIDHVESRLRERLLELPDGQWREVQYLDHDGHQQNLRPIVCTLTKKGDQLTLDFHGSAPEVEGFANCAFGGLRAAALSGICVTLGYDLTWNDGVARCVDIVAPPRSIVTAEYPTPVSMATISAIIVTLNLVMTTASKLLLSSPKHHEEAMAAWCGTSIGYSIAGVNEDGVFGVCAEASHFGAGCGARTYGDGVDTGGIIINTTANIPSIEETENEYPVLYLTRHQLEDSGGPGRFRGGVSGGVALVPYRNQGTLETSFAGVGAAVPNGFGIAGGLPGATLRLLRFNGDQSLEQLRSSGRLPSDLDEMPGTEERLPPNVSRLSFPAEVVEYHNWQGAGGYGDPLDRDPLQVLDDVLSRTVSQRCAADIYGVAIVDGSVDEEQTERLRASIRSDRLTRAVPASEFFDGQAELDGLATLSVFDGDYAGTTLAYGDHLVFDFDADAIRCRNCDHRLAGVREDFRDGTLVERRPLEAAGPVRGEGHAGDDISLLCYYCRCGTQLEVEVAVAGSPRAGMRLSGLPRKAVTS